ncbi:FAD-dependent oxidoreductase [Pseudohongiella nitratireducens]|uniref:FAD-dependent oxidoreductase n=1 Tax=Pseudohongiella nitratireducens TaxID=1768907 RepID=UPI0030EBE99D|tara:strand:+ start:1302 stop:2435 length:1134 start_codon:yes stop_codon:yes gene_type:complete
MTKNNHNERLLLLGAGHAHMVAMRQWLEQGTALPKDTILINPEPEAWYSGMMPGLIAGRFAREDCLIELEPLCQQLGIQLQLRRVVSLDIQSQCVWFRDGGNLPFSLLSINSGSVTHALPSDGSIALLPVKPFADFYRRWQTWRQDNPQATDVAIVGGGAAAVEIALAVSANSQLHGLTVTVYVDRDVLAGFPANVSGRVQKLLGRRGVKIQPQARVGYIENGMLYRSDNNRIASADVVIAATGSAALSWYHNSQLSTDSDGFILVEPTLQAIRQSNIFVSGDACSLANNPRSGVYAVRHGDVLARNIPAQLQGNPLQNFYPQTKALALLSTGNGGAVARYGTSGASHSLLRPILGLWKDQLDKSYIRDHSVNGAYR